MNKWTQSSQISLGRWGRRHMYRKGKERHQTCEMESYESLKYELSGENVWPLLLFEVVRLWIRGWKKSFRMENLGKKRCLSLKVIEKLPFGKHEVIDTSCFFYIEAYLRKVCWEVYNTKVEEIQTDLFTGMSVVHISSTERLRKYWE